MKTTIRLPDIEVLQEKTRSVRTDSDPSNIRFKLVELFGFYEIINFELGYEWPIWRVRKCKDEEGYANLREISYPPPEETRAGRLNNKGQPALYTSLHNFTAITEVGAEEGDYLHIIGFQIRRGAKLRCAIIGEIFNTHRSGQAKLSEALGNRLNRILNNSDFRAARSWVFLDAFFSMLLADKTAANSDYIHSRIVADLINEKLPDIDAIYYPSVLQENGVNLAIKPDAVNRLLQVSGTSVIKINRKYDYGIYDFSMVRNLTIRVSDGAIYWKT